MTLVALIASLFTAALMLFFASGEATGNAHALRGIDAVRFPRSLVWLLVAAQCAGAVGLILGIWWPILGVLAAAALTLFFVAAVIAHLRVRDWRGSALPATIFLISAITLTLVTINAVHS